jgi:hypothetical protein
MSTNMSNTTWEPPTTPPSGRLNEQEREQLPDTAFAFPKERKEPLTDAAHVQDALARFDQVEDVDTHERDLAWRNILKAAQHYGVQVEESDWHELGGHPKTPNPKH